MASTSWMAGVSLLFVLTVISPALARPQDLSIAAVPSFDATPTIPMVTAIALAAETPLQTPGPPTAPKQLPPGPQPGGAAVPQQQQDPTTPPKGGPNNGGNGTTGAPPNGGGHGPPGGAPQGPFKYQASFSFGAAGAILFFGSFVVSSYQFFKYKTWFIMLFPQAILAHVIACIARLHAILHPKAITAIIIQTMCFQMVPSLIAINVIMIFTRVVWWITPNDLRNRKNIGLPPHHISLIWAGCVALPDMAKGIAGNLGKPKDHKAPPSPNNIWNRVQQVALVLQFFVIVGWTAWCALFMHRSSKWIIPVEIERAGYRVIGWATVLAGCFLSWRILYLTIEHDANFSPKSYISTHEWLFWFAGQLPMFIVYTIFNVWHPGKFFPREYTRFKFDTKKLEQSKRDDTWPPTISHPMPSQSPQAELRDPKGFEFTMTEMAPHPGRKV